MTALYHIGDFVGMIERPVMVSPLPKLWYLLRLHPNYDLKAERQLNERGVSVYVPKEKRTVRTVWGRSVLQEVPIFSGAMFVPDFEADLTRLKRLADGIGGFVRFGAEPLRLSLAIMADIRSFEARMQAEPIRRRFEQGRHVRITSGPYAFWEGQIARLDRHHRLSVLIDILGRMVPIALDEDQVEAIAKPKGGAVPRRTTGPARAISRKARRRIAR